MRRKFTIEIGACNPTVHPDHLAIAIEEVLKAALSTRIALAQNYFVVDHVEVTPIEEKK
jgi:hypothetical protein